MIPNMKNDIEINSQFAKALKYIEGGKNVFITGKAGTGKSTLLAYFRTKTKKNIAVLAPTGVAAVNVKGQTIHFFFFSVRILLLKKSGKTIKNPETPVYTNNLMRW